MARTHESEMDEDGVEWKEMKQYGEPRFSHKNNKLVEGN